MSIIRWKPLRDVTAWHPANDITNEFTTVQREMDRMFDRFLRGGVVEDESVCSWLPPVDIFEKENEFLVHVELPGVDKNDVKINVANSVLTIKGEKKSVIESKEKNYHRMERCYGSFQRSFSLPTSVKADKIEASYNNGILEISLPKVEEAKPKEIEVKVK